MMGVSLLPVQSDHAPGLTIPKYANQPGVDQIGSISQPWRPGLPLTTNNSFYHALDPVSPVSPIETTKMQPIVSPRPYRPVDADRSAALRQLERPLLDSSGTTRSMNVGQEIYNGQASPEYKSPLVQITAASRQNLVIAPKQDYRNCKTCGRRRSLTDVKDSAGQRLLEDCTKCGKRKAGMSLGQPGGFPSSQTRSVSDSIVTTMNMQAATSSKSNGNTSSRPCCNKCGKKQRPSPLVASSWKSASDRTFANSPTVSERLRSVPRVLSFGLESPRPTHTALPRLQSDAFVGIDLTPPTASTYQSVSSQLPDNSPLLDGRKPKREKLSRSSSIVSAISRTFSRRKSENKPAPVVTARPPSRHQLQKDGAHSPGRFTKLTDDFVHDDTIQGHGRLSATDIENDRPGSPFSFTDKPAEDETFELNDIRVSKMTINSETGLLFGPRSAPIMEETDAFEEVQRPDHFRSKSEGIATTLAVLEENDMFLANPNQRPGITRFKSLKSGVNRAASVTRSTSLRRLNSIKKTPELWYRSDMALEGAIGAY